MIDLSDFIKSSIEGLIIASIFLLLGLVFLPDSISLKVIKHLKPKIFEKAKYAFRSIVHLLIYNNYERGVHETKKEEVLKKIESLKKELVIQEKSVFFIDSLIGIFEMLSYIMYTDSQNNQLYESTSEYFAAYCTRLFKLENKILQRKIGEEFFEFSSKIQEISDKYENSVNTHNLKEIKLMCKEQQQVACGFSEYLDSIKQKTSKRITEIEEELILLTNNFIRDIEP